MGNEKPKNIDLTWRRYQSGEKSTFDILYDHYFPGLFAFCLGLLKNVEVTEDIVSDVFIKLFQYPNPEDIQSVDNWLYKVAKNSSLTYLSKQKRRNEIAQSIPKERYSQDNTINEQLLDLEELDKQLKVKLKDMDYKLWQLHMDGYDNSEIADRLGMNEKTVANRKTMLKNTMKDIIGFSDREKDQG